MLNTLQTTLRSGCYGLAIAGLVAFATVSPADAQGRGGGGRGGRGGGQQQKAPDAEPVAPPAPAAAPLPWPRLEKGAILCKSRDELYKYQVQLMDRRSAATDEPAPDCEILATQVGVDIISNDGPSRTQVTVKGETTQTGWTNTYFPANPPAR